MVGQAKVVDKLRELARNLWWTWQPNVISLFRELHPDLWRATDHNPIAFLKEIPAEALERLAAEVALHSRVDYAFRRLSEYLKNTDSWGNLPRLELEDPPGRLLLGRVRPAREPADLFRRPRRPGRRPPQERQRPGRPADRPRPALRRGVFPPVAQRRRLAARDLPRQQSRDAADRAGARPRGKADPDFDRHPGRRAPRQGLAGRSGPDDPPAARFESRGKQRVRPRPDLAPLRRRRPGPDSSGIAPGGRRRPGGPGVRHPSVGAPPQRGPQRVRRAGDDPDLDGIGRDAVRRGRAGSSRR